MGLLGTVTPATAKNSQAEWFSSDLTPTQSGLAYVHIAITSSVAIDYTMDSGTTWLGFNQDAALTADVGYTFVIPMTPSTLFNIRKTSSGNVTVSQCDVVLV